MWVCRKKDESLFATDLLVIEFAQVDSLPKHMAEHIYMFSGQSVQVKIRTFAEVMGQLIDWFGRNFHILQEDDDELIISSIRETRP